MVVQHNLTAMNSNRMLGMTSKAQAKSTEKLSSGYKINRAADDAAGLSISEKMRKQIRGLTQASANAQDGISAVQTAEGALSEVQDMLQRMNELAVKSANGTNSADDRSYIQNEIDQLTTEIDRVAETTKFNETYLLKGSENGPKDYTYSYQKETTTTTGTIGALVDVNTVGATFTSATAGAGTASADDINAFINDMKKNGVTFDYDATSNTAGDGVASVKLSSSLKAKGYTVTKNGNDFTVRNSANEAVGKFTWDTSALTADKSGNVKAPSAGNVAAKDLGADKTLYDVNGNKISANALSNYFKTTEAAGVVTTEQVAGKDVYDAVGNKITNLADAVASVNAVQEKTGALELTLHVGADATANNQIQLNIKSMSASGLGVDNLKVDGETDKNALDAIDTIKEAIQKVSTQRSGLGAVQNRLEHTISNLDNVVENTTSAESAIRDTNMATEMVKYSNNNILAQAGQAMLAQANQSNQGVLSLLG